jgi:hypothetical protein
MSMPLDSDIVVRGRRAGVTEKYTGVMWSRRSSTDNSAATPSVCSASDWRRSRRRALR